MNEIHRDIQNQEKKSSIPRIIYNVLIALACIYIFFLLYQSVYFNYQTSKKIRTLKSELANSEVDQMRFESLNAYYKTWAFQELEARKKLGFKMPGEKAIQVKVEESVQPMPSNQPEKTDSMQGTKSNFQKWVDYVMGKTG